VRNTDDILNPIEPEAPTDAVRESFEPVLGDWFTVRMVNDVAHVIIHGEVGCTRPWKDLAAATVGADDIKLFIDDSPGGDCISAANLFHELHGRVSETVISGRCFSAALPIALAGKKIRMEKHARILLHCPHSWIYSDAAGMRSAALYLDKTTAFLKKIIMERTELSETSVAGWLNGADVYFSAEQAFAYGLVDEIFVAPKLEPLPVSAPITRPTGQVLPTFTPDEQLVFDLLNSLRRLKVNNRQNFLREVNANLFYNTDEITL
jgi:ATP-dependent protease ClpP protease subunit